MKSVHIFLTVLTGLILCSCAQKGAAPDDFSSAVVYEMNVRQLTPEGTLAAASAHLPRLKELGVDVVWLMPIHPIGTLQRKGSLGSYYSIADYRAVNPEFGTLEDFDAFVKKAHGLGLKVILDWVANHTSPDHPWVSEKPACWYVRDSLGHTVVEYDWTDIAKLDYSCPEVREEMLSCMRFWVDRGVDGFRCDMAYIVPQDFWAQAIPSLRTYASKPLFFLAEGEETWLPEVGFDVTYSWRLHHLMNDIAQEKAGKEDLLEYIRWNAENYPEGPSRLTFITNHDENSWAGTEFERMGYAWRMMSVLCFTLPQSRPLLYTAQEIGWDHRFLFFEKDPVPADQWSDEFNESYYTEFYRDLASDYHKHPALRKGSFEILDNEDFDNGDDQTLVFRRVFETDTVTVITHLRDPWEYSIQ